MKFPVIALSVVGTAACIALPPTAPATPTSSTPPALQIVRQNGQIAIEFSGALETATDPRGPWTQLPEATHPWPIDPSAAVRRFFRTRAPDDDSVFSSRTVVDWTLTGPLQTHFDLAFAGQPDGIFPPRRETPYFDGTVAMLGVERPVSLRVRGHSSLQECPFPKLKLKIARSDREGTPFADAREIKIGSHCAEGGRGPVGRLRDESAAYREALAYEVLDALGFLAPRVRRARIDYRDTSPGDDLQAVGWRIVRQALVLEHIEVVAERLGGRALSDEEVADLEGAAFDPQLIADLRLAHALLGNWDYALSEDGTELWNVEVIEHQDGTLVPVAGDFDLASWVTGEVRLNAPHDYRPDLPDLERQAHFEIGQIRARAGATAFEAGRARFEQHREVLEVLVDNALLDEPGRDNARRHVAAFFEALTAVR